ncbi:enoyl-CoA hydratase/isomerase family protein [Caldifermentibacillus hisashii]|jgi:enoyl-CoA hydratase|uniref:enoyl-CoA hydratase/isomerase family protein n=1 Tax=Caldifermentibacillus hisashii TaxID=996558 RepID=UPI0031FD0DB0
MNNYENIISYKDGAIGVVKINRPEVRNALDNKTISEIEDAMNYFEKNEAVKVIVLTGEGEKAFAAGADINELKIKKAQDALLPGLQGLCTKIENSHKVTIAAINGYAFGGGCELALACDIRIASENAKIALPELNLSIIPGGGGTQRLARIIGKGRAIDMILTGKAVTAEKAEQIGLVSEVVPLEELWVAVLEKANQILTKGPFALKMAKMVIHQGYDIDQKSALLLEKFAQAILFESDDKHEGVTSFLEKRSPMFGGK